MSGRWTYTFRRPDGTTVQFVDAQWRYLPALRPLAVQSEGVLVGRRGTINYTSAVEVPTDNPAENRVDLPLGGGAAVGALTDRNGYLFTQLGELIVGGIS